MYFGFVHFKTKQWQDNDRNNNICMSFATCRKEKEAVLEYWRTC